MFVICAGHSDSDSGAVSKDGKYKEALLALELRNIVASKLRERGADVVTDGVGESNAALKDAIKLLKTNKGIGVEFHFNAAGSSSAKGVETLALPKDKKLAQEISQVIAGVLDTTTRGDKGFKTQEESARGTLGFVREGGLIVEVCFISNPEEMAKYEAKKWLVASAVVEVLLRYK